MSPTAQDTTAGTASPPTESTRSSAEDGGSIAERSGFDFTLLYWLVPLPWLAWALVRTFGLEAGYPAVGLIALTPYAAVSCLLPLAVLLWRRQWLPSGLVVVALVLFAVAIAPRVLGGQPADYPDGRHLRVLTVNFELGAEAADDLMAIVRDEKVDLLVLQQMSLPTRQALDAAGLEASLPESWPREPSPTMIFSTLALDSAGEEPAPPGDAGLIGASARVPRYGGVEVWAVHAQDPTTGEKAEAWRETLDQVALLGTARVPRVLAGDFNATLDHVELREILDTGYVDAAGAIGAGLVPTFPARGLRPPPISIDHVLVDERIEVEDTTISTLPHADHRAVLAELVLPPRRG
jgi:endonuclease/exonuclease/phosphatase (EEP) superfamily protein YafD